MKFSACIQFNNNLYAFCLDRNILVKYNGKDRCAKIIGSIPAEPYKTRGLVSRILVYGDILLLVPENASSIWLFNIGNNSWKEVAFEQFRLRFKFQVSFIYDNKAYMIGCYYNGIAIYDFITEKLTCCDNTFSRWNRRNEGDIFFRDCAFVGSNTVLLPSCLSNEIAILDLGNMEISIKTIGDEGDRFESMIVYDGNCYITLRNSGKIYIWDLRDDLKTIPVEGYRGEKEDCHYCGIVEIGKKLYFLANNDAKSFIYTPSINHIETTGEEFLFCHKDEKNTIVQTKNEEIWIIDSKIQEIGSLNKKKFAVSGFLPMEKKQIFYESDEYSLESFIYFD